VQTLSRLLEDPARPLVTVLGGAKVSDKIGVIERFRQLADRIIIGGAMCFPFFAAQGHDVGASLCASEDVELALGLLQSDQGVQVELPVDLVVADRLDAAAQTRTIDGVDVPDGMMGLGIGPLTATSIADAVHGAGTVFWNGPMGAFELGPFAAGPQAVAEAVAAAPGTTVVGGGDSGAALSRFGLADQVTHLSTGGGASLEAARGQDIAGS
jgi:phosphoglycerate kinase